MTWGRCQERCLHHSEPGRWTTTALAKKTDLPGNLQLFAKWHQLPEPLTCGVRTTTESMLFKSNVYALTQTFLVLVECCGRESDIATQSVIRFCFGIIAALAAKFFVVNLQVRSGPATLASPAIAAQHLFSELFVRLGIKPQARLFGSNPVHEAFSVTSCRKACRCSPGRNLKNRDMDCRSTVGSSFSRFAPARKSAQIISRQ